MRAVRANSSCGTLRPHLPGGHRDVEITGGRRPVARDHNGRVQHPDNAAGCAASCTRQQFAGRRIWTRSGWLYQPSPRQRPRQRGAREHDVGGDVRRWRVRTGVRGKGMRYRADIVNFVSSARSSVCAPSGLVGARSLERRPNTTNVVR